jgi:hypothetical protein
VIALRREPGGFSGFIDGAAHHLALHAKCDIPGIHYTGLSLEETLREGWRKAVHPDDEMRVLGAWMEALARGRF